MLQVRSPHVGADEADPGNDLLAHGCKESLEGLDGPLLAHPEPTGDADIDLIDQRQTLVALGVWDFVNADGGAMARVGRLTPHQMLRRSVDRENFADTS